MPRRSHAATPTVARIDVRKTYKLYIGGAFPRTESGRSYVVNGGRRRRRSPTPVRASRKDLRDAVRAARKAFPDWADRTAMNRGQILYRVAELMEGRRDQFADEVAPAEGVRADKARDARRPRDRPLGLVRRLGRQDRPGPRPVEPGRGALLQLHDPGADGRRRRRRAGDVVAARASCRGSRRRSSRGNTAVVLTSETRPLPAITPDRGPRHLRRAGGRHQRPHRPQARARAGPRGARGRRRARRVGRPRRSADRDRERRGQREAARPPPEGIADRASTGSTTAPRERPEWIAAFLEMKTVWHPIGR